jgi:hypothetical protein
VSNILGINFWRQRTRDGWRYRYGVRGIGPIYQEFYRWMRNHPTAGDDTDDWPWYYFAFADPVDDAILQLLFIDHLHRLEDDDEPYVEPAPPTPEQIMLGQTLCEAVTQEINRDIFEALGKL